MAVAPGLALALLLLLEGAARIAHGGDLGLRPSNPWYVFSADLGWAPRPNYEGAVCAGGPGVATIPRTSFGPDGLLAIDTPDADPGAGPTAVFIGNSNTFGWCVPAESTFVEVVQRLSKNLKTINLGVPGYTSYQGYRTLDRALAFEPDVIVVSFNFNDRRSVLRPGAVDSEAYFQWLYSQEKRERVRLAVRDLYLVRGLLLVLEKTPGTHALSPGASTVRLDTLRARVAPESFRQNLRGIVALARRNDIPLVFLLLGDNPAQVADLRQGIEHVRHGRHESAIRHLRKTVEEHIWFSALARLYLAEAYRALGRTDAAVEALTVTRPFDSLHGGFPIFLDTEYAAVMREVAAEHGVRLVDAATALEKSPAVYFDFGHFDAEGHRRVGALVRDAIEEALAETLLPGAGRPRDGRG